MHPHNHTYELEVQNRCRPERPTCVAMATGTIQTNHYDNHAGQCGCQPSGGNHDAVCGPVPSDNSKAPICMTTVEPNGYCYGCRLGSEAGGDNCEDKYECQVKQNDRNPFNRECVRVAEKESKLARVEYTNGTIYVSHTVYICEYFHAQII